MQRREHVCPPNGHHSGSWESAIKRQENISGKRTAWVEAGAQRKHGKFEEMKELSVGLYSFRKNSSKK